MFKFTSSHNVLSGNRLEFSIARRDGSEFQLILSRSTGFLPSQEFAKLNSSTARFQPLTFSKEGNPTIWLDVDYERDPRGFTDPGSILGAMLEAEPRVPVRLTGRKKIVKGDGEGKKTGWAQDEREIVEVELLLEEDELARCCYYCGSPENDWDRNTGRFECLSGQGYESTYRCFRVCSILIILYAHC